SGETAEPRRSQDALVQTAGPEPFDPLQYLDMPAAHLAGVRLQHLSAAQCLQTRGTAEHERLAPDRQCRFIDEQLSQGPLSRPNSVTVEQRYRRQRLQCADVQANLAPVLDGPRSIHQAV